MSLLDYYPAFALVAILGGFWGYAVIQRRRLLEAVAEAASRLKGMYKPGGRFSGGTLEAKVGGRDVVFIFNLSHSARNESTSIVASLTKPAVKYVHLRGREAIARAPWLARYSGLFAPVRLEIVSDRVQADLFGVVRSADALVELATSISALAAEVEKS
jgi:hypothetical protein